MIGKKPSCYLNNISFSKLFSHGNFIGNCITRLFITRAYNLIRLKKLKFVILDKSFAPFSCKAHSRIVGTGLTDTHFVRSSVFYEKKRNKKCTSTFAQQQSRSIICLDRTYYNLIMDLLIS